MHAAGLLTRIYAIRDNGLLGNPEGYALPLAVRRIGAFVYPAMGARMSSGCPLSERLNSL